MDRIERIKSRDPVRRFLEKMVQLFIRETALEIEAMNRAFLAKDYQKVSAIAHKIKPSVNYICITRLYNDVRSIENWDESQSKMKIKVPEFMEDIKSVIEQLKQKY